MSIEKRQSRRISLNFTVQAHYRDRRSFPLHVENINLDGMFLRSPGLQVGKSALLELEFTLGGRSWQIPALVIHTTPNHGFGVLFHESQHDLYAIASILADKHPTPSVIAATTRRPSYSGASSSKRFQQGISPGS